MKTLQVKIRHIDFDSRAPYYETVDDFEFPSNADKTAFFEIVSPALIETIGPRKNVITQCYLAWEVLRECGWVADNSRDGYLLWCKPETSAEELELALKHRDWTYQYSDDYRTWCAGQAEDTRIANLEAKVDPDIVKALYEKYAPK
jgi:hypothetical protein